MPGPAFNIVTVSGGTVVEKTAAGLKDKDLSTDTTQHWTLEYDGDSDTKVAFQNVSNGEYLNCSSGAAYGKIDTSTSKQWWTLEKGRAPGSCWIKCNDWPDAYLCNANGSYVSNNTVYAWPKQAVWTHALTWYLKDANAEGFKPTGYSVSAESSGSQQADDLKSREEALAKKEQDLASSEATYKQQSEQLEAKEKELKDMAEKQTNAMKSDGDASAEAKKLADQQADLQRQLDELRSKERELASREAVAAKQESQAYETAEKLKKQTSDKEAELQRKEQDLAQRETRLASANASAGDSSKLKADNDRLAQQLKELRQQLGAAQALCANEHSADSQGAAKAENARLKDLIAQLALQLTEAQKQRPRKLATTKGSSTNGASAPATKTTPSSVPRSRPGAVLSSQAKAQSTESKLAAIEAENARLAAEVEKLKHQPSPSPRQTNGTAATKTEDPKLAALKAENARLAAELQKLQTKPSPSPQHTNGSAVTQPEDPAQAAMENARLGEEIKKYKQQPTTAKPAAAAAITNGSPAPVSNGANTSKGRTPSQTPSRSQRPVSAKPNPAPAKPTGEGDRLKAEQARLKQQIEALKNPPVAKVSVGSHIGAHVNGGSGPKVETAGEDEIVYDCGHVVHPPPRKVHKRVVGILYER